MSMSLKFNYIPYKVNKMIYLFVYQKHDCKQTKGIGFDVCVYYNVYTFMYINYFLNMLFLIC